MVRGQAFLIVVVGSWVCRGLISRKGAKAMMLEDCSFQVHDPPLLGFRVHDPDLIKLNQVMSPCENKGGQAFLIVVIFRRFQEYTFFL